MGVLSEKSRKYLLSLKLEGKVSMTTHLSIVDNFVTERDLIEIIDYLVDKPRSKK